ncbi:MAG TPA: MotA/TolQ/ExbB proton channel family protein, partial [Terriglobales bacterium]|nr:MotA/TolQ/ExbB proton channel family protein [Terriglobales bacterium]
IRENATREPEVVEKMLEAVERRDIEGALAIGKKSKDFIARILVYTLTNKEFSLSNAFVRASGQELARFSQGMATLDTVITAAPLLGLLGTVTGMIAAFGVLSTSGMNQPNAITGGVAEALIATAVGLGIAIVTLVPYNYFSAKVERAAEAMERCGSRIEQALSEHEIP